jgi:hypothetical protein
MAAGVTFARPWCGSRLSSSRLPTAAACAAAASTLTMSRLRSGICAKVTATAGACPSRSAKPARVSFDQSMLTPSRAPEAGASADPADA